ncbi:MAG: HAMP domain-containing histidine kinase, partial [Sphingomonas bacterium]|nr:HAMP domain-containing histidine kinase [Sphingomonas bacterium]
AQGYAGKLPPAASDYVDAILESVERLAKLIDDVLDLTEGDRRGIVLDRERIDMAGLCRTVAESIEPRATDRKQSFKLDIDPSAGVVIGDARRLRESLEHVLRNAVAYTPDKGKIALTAAGDDQSVTISVTDNGQGIAPEDQQDVFTRFHSIGGVGRGDAALGLGLPLTRQFIEAHGGKVGLESAVGEGTRVTMIIPRAPQ